MLLDSGLSTEGIWEITWMNTSAQSKVLREYKGWKKYIYIFLVCDIKEEFVWHLNKEKVWNSDED